MHQITQRCKRSIVAVLCVTGCLSAHAQEAGNYDAAAGLKGLVTDIPVFTPAVVTRRVKGGAIADCYSWFLESDEDMDTILSWYDVMLPDAVKTTFSDGGAIWAYLLNDMEDSASVLVHPDAIIEITECFY